MKNGKVVLILAAILTGSFVSQGQKTIAEGTIAYTILIKTAGSDPKENGRTDTASSTVYLKGNQSRTDIKSVLGNESTILDAKAGTAFILKEYSGQKLMITLTKENLAEKNKRYEDISFTETAETKTVAGYNCIKAIAKLKDGSSFNVYFTKELLPANKEYSSTFKNLPGLAMEYEFQAGKTTYTYTFVKLAIDAIAASTFDMPKSGYRVMTYDENKKIKRGES